MRNNAIETIRLATGCQVGWSDHTVEPAVINRAINRWESKVIEFHLDLDGKGENVVCCKLDPVFLTKRDINLIKDYRQK